MLKQSDVQKLPDGRHNFGQGLYLNVRGRSRSWVYRYTFEGKRGWTGLGSADTLPLTAARVLAARVKVSLSEGIPPTRAPKKVEEKSVEIRTFAEVAKEAVAVRTEVSQWKNAKHAQQWTNTLKTYALPKLGKLDIAEVTREDVLGVLRPIWKTKTETAMRLRGRLDVVFAYAIRQGWRTAANPAVWAGNLEFDLPSPDKIMERKHHTAMTVAEVSTVAAQLWADPTPTRLCILFGILTAGRCCEFVPTEWSEIDLKNKVWSVPAARRKDKKPYPHRVPLSTWAVKVLKKAKEMARDSGYVFPGRFGGHPSLESPRMILIRMVGRGVTMHGCRSTFRDWCEETGKDRTLAEKSLMHATGNAVEQAYQRSDLLAQRRKLMQEWADVVMSATP